MHRMLAQSARLVSALALLWCVLAAPAFLVAGVPALIGLAGAVLSCLVPGLGVVLLQAAPLGQHQPVVSLMTGMVLRIGCVLGTVLVVYRIWPDLPVAVFVVWLIPAYMVALAAETRMVLADVGGGRPLVSERCAGV